MESAAASRTARPSEMSTAMVAQRQVSWTTLGKSEDVVDMSEPQEHLLVYILYCIYRVLVIQFQYFWTQGTGGETKFISIMHIDELCSGVAVFCGAQFFHPKSRGWLPPRVSWPLVRPSQMNWSGRSWRCFAFPRGVVEGRGANFHTRDVDLTDVEYL